MARSMNAHGRRESRVVSEQGLLPRIECHPPSEPWSSFDECLGLPSTRIYASLELLATLGYCKVGWVELVYDVNDRWRWDEGRLYAELRVAKLTFWLVSAHAQ
jgi:hypothetical protein